MKTLTYHHVHALLRKGRGPARAHRCVSCGAPAKHWAYDRSDPDQLVEERYGQRVTYSTDLTRYQPMCNPCHHALDHPPKTHCNHGHELTGANVYNRPDGTRLCRRCKRETLQRWRAEHPNRSGVTA